MISREATTIELSWQSGAQKIDECEYLFLRNIRELEELTLGLTITEAKPQSPITSVESDDPVEQLRLGAKPIQEDETCRIFEVIFHRDHMVSYYVLNESYGRFPELPEQFTGKLFRIFSVSHLLDFTRQTTYATDAYPGPLQHYQIACLNHVVDVISTKPPKITVGKIRN